MVSTVVEYTLTFFIGVSLLTGLGVTTTQIVDNRDAQVTEDRLEHVGYEISTILSQHDNARRHYNQEADTIKTLTGTAPSGSFESSTVVDEPAQINGQPYTIQLVSDGGNKEVLLTASDTGVSTRVSIDDDIPLREGSGGAGGRVVVVYDETNDEFYLDSSPSGVFSNV